MFRQKRISPKDLLDNNHEGPVGSKKDELREVSEGSNHKGVFGYSVYGDIKEKEEERG